MGKENNTFYPMKDETTREKLFGNLNFKAIATDPNFKEDSVREVIILPI